MAKRDLLPVGSLFDKRYKILALLGRGGAGAVYKAEHEVLKQTVAIKTLHRKLVEDADKYTRFEREGQMLAGLSHINIIAAHDYGVTDDRIPYLVMQFVEGTTLHDAIQASGGLAPENLAGIVWQIADALAYSHQKGIIHRDLKPANIILIKNQAGEDQPKLVDFGIARLSLDSEVARQKLTRTGSVFGSPSYMSPEQWRAQPVDERSDIYSLGCVMYESLVNRLPYEIEDLVDLLMGEFGAQPIALKSAKPDLQISEQFEKLLFKAMSINLEERYQSANELKSALEQTPEYEVYRSNLGSSKKLELLQVLQRRAQERARKRLMLIAAGLSMVIMLASLIVFTLPGQILTAISSLALARLFYEPGSMPMFQAQSRLVELYKLQGDNAAAVKELKNMAEITERQAGDKSARLAGIFEELAQTYYSQINDKKAAAEYCAKAVKILDSLAIMDYQNGNRRTALGYFERALALTEKMLLPDKAREIPQRLLCIADVKLQNALTSHSSLDHSLAQRDYIAALDAWNHLPDPDPIQRSLIFVGLASSHADQGRYSEAEREYKSAMALVEPIVGPEYPSVKRIKDQLRALEIRKNK
jgi:tRNA A-37 threonylcarbamoyl transferase component Bud32